MGLTQEQHEALSDMADGLVDTVEREYIDAIRAALSTIEEQAERIAYLEALLKATPTKEQFDAERAAHEHTRRELALWQTLPVAMREHGIETGELPVAVGAAISALLHRAEQAERELAEARATHATELVKVHDETWDAAALSALSRFATLLGCEPSECVERVRVLREALERMVVLYESEWDADAPFVRPHWLVAALAPSRSTSEPVRLKAENEQLRKEISDIKTDRAERFAGYAESYLCELREIVKAGDALAEYADRLAHQECETRPDHEGCHCPVGEWQRQTAHVKREG